MTEVSGRGEEGGVGDKGLGKGRKGKGLWRVCVSGVNRRGMVKVVGRGVGGGRKGKGL